MKRFTQSFMALSMMAALGACSAKVEGGVVEIPQNPQASTTLDGSWSGTATGELLGNGSGVDAGGAHPCTIEMQMARAENSFTVQSVKFSCPKSGANFNMSVPVAYSLQAPKDPAVKAHELVLNGATQGWISLDATSAFVSAPLDANTKIVGDLTVRGAELHIGELRLQQGDLAVFTLKEGKLTKK